MSISWVGCRKHLGSSLEDPENGPTRTPVPSPIYGEREREGEGKNHEHQLGLLTCSLLFLLFFSNGNEQEKRKIRTRGKMKTSTIFSLPDFGISPVLISLPFFSLLFHLELHSF